MKKCSKCKKIFDESDFYPDKRRKSGLKYECKKCHKIYDRKLRKVNYANTEEYLKCKLTRRGLTRLEIAENKELIDVMKNLLILKRTIKWSNLKM